jgi:tRNA A-37 threonylcarbamoyl transferase component Bud32
MTAGDGRDDPPGARSLGPRSLVGLSEPAGAGGGDHDEAHHPFATADDQRYRELRVVGEGGLGTVLLAHDERLAREVALKRIGPTVDERTAAARFLREARITARLDHPGIVPIHDAGITADGRLYYTMRLIRGRSLAEVAAEARTPEARLGLVAALTAACHAVGHAHRQGIVHRDLKPANVMIGEQGETQVVDWGLAEELELAAAGTEDGYVGTAAYLSPEAARGDGCTAASDVWALGVILHELVSGARRFTGERDEVIRALRAGALPEVRWPDEVPPELRAIAARAMAPAPAARYPDAEAMARDLEAYRDGRRVAAYAYSPLELARRLIVAWRWPLALGAASVVATIAALALTAHRTEGQRARAVVAEGRARAELARAEEARGRAEEALGWALASSAVAALEAGRAAQAEVLAAHALGHGESADARGVLAAVRAGARPAASRRVAIPGCAAVVPGGYDLALCVDGDHVAAWELAPVRQRWRVPLAVVGAVELDAVGVVGWMADGTIVVLDPATGAERARIGGLARAPAAAVDALRERVALHDGATIVVVGGGADAAPWVVHGMCEARAIDAVAPGDASVWAVCDDGTLRRAIADAPVVTYRATGFGTERRRASAMSLGEGELDLAIAGLGGDVLLLDLRPCNDETCVERDDATWFAAATPHAIRHVACLGNEAIAIPDHGDAVLVRRGVGAELLRLPVDDGRDARFLEYDVVAGGTEWRRWDLALGLPPRRLVTGPGLVTGALSGDGQRLAVADERGAITVWSTVHGQVEASAATDVRAAVAALAAPAPPARLDGPRRAHVLGADGAVVRTVEIRDAELTAVATSADGRWLAGATSAGWIEVWDATTGRHVARLRGHRQRATWVAFHGDALWSAGWDGAALRWSVAALDAPAATLVAEASAAWALTLDDVLARQGAAPATAPSPPP